ncbi:MAG TPA: hypothetical protein VN837_16990 [Chloroflexota bacterium]|nr:hypothetical protein [Chloroflexota bacterium]
MTSLGTEAGKTRQGGGSGAAIRVLRSLRVSVIQEEWPGKMEG